MGFVWTTGPDGASWERPGAARPPRAPNGLICVTFWIQEINCS
jgi:hypothetical protein